MLRSRAGFGLAAVLLAAACGGNVDGGEGESTPDPDGASTPPGPSDAPGASDDPKADTELGSCKLGVSAYGEDSSPCAWVADNRCYTSRAMACNCACPRDRDSQCASGFEAGPDGRVSVRCF